MATTISVNKQSVSELLKSGRVKPFIIPEYQRPYAWTYEEIDVLFDDLWEFSNNIGGLDRNGTYFLGSIVSYDNDDNEQEIIDGQQRITSLFLLLRAIYTKLVNGDDVNSDAAQNFIRQIEPAIWRTDNKTGKVDFSNILLTSKVVNNEGNDILRRILETGIANTSATDNYSKNYIRFQELYSKHCEAAPLRIYDFVYALLHQAILLPIGADSQDTALTIFSTLNDRGLPLSDADIFKAKIYNNLSTENKDSFVKEWQSLEQEAAEVKESIQSLFYYYMFYLRAKEGDINTTTIGVRKFYSVNKFERLYKSDLMSDLRTLLNLWKVINANQDIPGEDWDNDSNIRKALDILMAYPNEYWKYPVVVYYMSHRMSEDFNEVFLKFLHKLILELMTRFIIVPTLNAVKHDILRLNARIPNGVHPEFSFKPMDTTNLRTLISNPHRSIVRMLLKTYAYNHQEALLPSNWQIEHILPQKWQKTFFTDVEESVINEMIEHIGNKTPFERKLNIVASNGYFNKKQEDYKKSEIEVTRALVAAITSDWSLPHIENRDKVVTDEIINLISKWEEEYQSIVLNSKDNMPSSEELKLIEEFKKKGWIN